MLDNVISAGRYRLGRTLARGGMAQVRLGLDVTTGHAVAVKQLASELVSEEHARRLFASEAKASADLDHPGVVRVLDSGEAEDVLTGISTPYLVMEFVPGHSLTTLTRRATPIATEKALGLTRELLDALAYCHGAGLVHGDIKPANVMVMPTGQIKLTDFGLASRAGDFPRETEYVPGFLTIRYASPEQIQRTPTDARSDLYSVGCVLYELVTGRTPFVGEPEDVLANHLFDRAPAPSTLSPDITADVDAMVLRALEKDPDDRYPSAAAMIADIDLFLERRQAGLMVLPVSGTIPGSSAADLPYWPALTALARTREVRRRRSIRSISAVAAALLPVAGFGLLHLRGPADVGGSAAALSLGGVVQPQVHAIQPPVAPPRAMLGAAMLDPRNLDNRGTVILARYSGSQPPASVGVSTESPEAVAGREASVGTTAAKAEADPQESRTKPRKPQAKREQPKSDEPKPSKPKPDEPKPDQPKPDQPKPDQPKPDQPKPKPDEPKPDQPKPEPDKPKPEPDKPKPDKPKPEPDKPKPDKPKPKPDKPKPEKPKPDKPAPEQPEPDEPE